MKTTTMTTEEIRILCDQSNSILQYGKNFDSYYAARKEAFKPYMAADEKTFMDYYRAWAPKDIKLRTRGKSLFVVVPHKMSVGGISLQKLFPFYNKKSKTGNGGRAGAVIIASNPLVRNNLTSLVRLVIELYREELQSNEELNVGNMVLNITFCYVIRYFDNTITFNETNADGTIVRRYDPITYTDIYKAVCKVLNSPTPITDYYGKPLAFSSKEPTPSKKELIQQRLQDCAKELQRKPTRKEFCDYINRFANVDDSGLPVNYYSYHSICRLIERHGLDNYVVTDGKRGRKRKAKVPAGTLADIPTSVKMPSNSQLTNPSSSYDASWVYAVIKENRL